MNLLLILFGKILSKLIQTFNLGHGSTWPGHIALAVNKHFLSDIFSQSSTKIILIAGTNGKTTSSRLIRTALVAEGKRVIHNESGANLLNGIASSLIMNANLSGKLNHDFAIFEVDENTLPLILKVVKPDYLLLLNLFRDQLDRYGEVDSIARKWQEALKMLSQDTTLILNADDPKIAYLANFTKAKIKFFGLNDFLQTHPHPDPLPQREREFKRFINMPQHAADSVYCPKCGFKLNFNSLSFSHLGDWSCKHCGLKRPEVDISHFDLYPLLGVYNKYNTHVAVLTLRKIGLNNKQIGKSFKNFSPAFGRQEIINYKGKKAQIFLSKNPTSFNQSYTTIKELGAKTLLLVLNDRIPDGRDVSWIWDVDLQGIEQFEKILISGDRVYDMALRVKYEILDQRSKIKDPHFAKASRGRQNYSSKVKTFEDLRNAIEEGLRQTDKNEILYILPTYSAMLEVRKILTGKKIL